jgi:hypothetical protein
MEEPHKGVPYIDLVLNWCAHQMLLTRCTPCDLEENQSATGGRILGFKVKFGEVSMQAADIMPRIEGDKLRTKPKSVLKC